jgi:2-iminobutanoate/2-iminopropanoate deaminase
MASDIERKPAATELEKSLGASHTVRAGNHIYVSGQLPTDGSGELITSGRLDHHFERALSNVVAAVEAAGGTANQIVATHMFLTRFPDEEEFLGICDSHRSKFGDGDRPTGTMVYVPRLPLEGAMAAITAVAIVQ